MKGRFEELQRSQEKMTFRAFLYNREKGEYLGRTPLSWFQIITFYLVFYSCLLTIFCLCLMLFLRTLSAEEPYFKGEESIIGNTPGLDYFPKPPEVNGDSDLIWFTQGENGNWHYYTEKIKKAAEMYFDDDNPDYKRIDCEDGEVPVDDEVCNFYLNDDEDSFGGCIPSNDYGYSEGGPCVFMKINRIYGWKPEVYNSTELPEEASADLKELASDTDLPPMVYIECAGVYPEDKIHLGLVNYYPQNGFPAYYFPYLNQPGYVSPLVAVQFEDPRKDMLINVKCSLWAKNIKRGEQVKLGTTRFSLIIDDEV